MRFSCPSCSAKYSITDEKIRNRIVKVRCKKCSQVFRIQDPNRKSAADAEPAPGADAVQPPAPKRKPTWFVIINRKQIGPLTFAQVVGLVRQGKATSQTYCWKPGQKEWKKMGEVPQLLKYLTVKPAVAPPPPIPTAPEKQPAQEASSPTTTVLERSQPTPEPKEKSAPTLGPQAHSAPIRLKEDSSPFKARLAAVSQSSTALEPSGSPFDSGELGPTSTARGSEEPFFPVEKDSDVVMPFFPAATAEEEPKSKKQLKDLVTEFSVMVRLNRRSRRFMIFSIAAAIVLIGAAVAVFYLARRQMDTGKMRRTDSYSPMEITMGRYEVKDKPNTDTPPPTDPKLRMLHLKTRVVNKVTKRIRKHRTTKLLPHVVKKVDTPQPDATKPKLVLVTPRMQNLNGVVETRISVLPTFKKKADPKVQAPTNDPKFNREVNRIVSKHRNNLVTKCARMGALAAVPRISVAFFIQPNGQPARIRVAGKNLEGQYQRCMQRRIAAWRFPASQIGKKHQFSLVL